MASFTNKNSGTWTNPTTSEQQKFFDRVYDSTVSELISYSFPSELKDDGFITDSYADLREAVITLTVSELDFGQTGYTYNLGSVDLVTTESLTYLVDELYDLGEVSVDTSVSLNFFNEELTDLGTVDVRTTTGPIQYNTNDIFSRSLDSVDITTTNTLTHIAESLYSLGVVTTDTSVEPIEYFVAGTSYSYDLSEVNFETSVGGLETSILTALTDLTITTSNELTSLVESLYDLGDLQFTTSVSDVIGYDFVDEIGTNEVQTSVVNAGVSLLVDLYEA
jgi:hypothetical protein